MSDNIKNNDLIIYEYEEKGLIEESTIKDFLIIQKEENRNVQRNVIHYNLDVIISFGYRVKSLRGTQNHIRLCSKPDSILNTRTLPSFSVKFKRDDLYD